jgi:branched-chain amino acid transport system permease protein
LVAGLVFYLMPAIFTRWLPASWSQVPTILFGLGAVALAQAPDGVLSMYGAYLKNIRSRFGVRATPPIESVAQAADVR